jgi:hypothetical protein
MIFVRFALQRTCLEFMRNGTQVDFKQRSFPDASAER